MVKLRENESLESLIKRFKDYVDNEGIIKEWRDRQYFKKPSAKKHEARRKAIRRHQNLSKKK